MDSISFDFAADYYDATRAFPEGVAEKVAESLLSALEDAPTVLEVGIGTGRIARPLLVASAERDLETTSGRLHLFGADISTRMLSRLRQQLSPGTPQPNLILGSALALPFPNRVFDAALMVHVIHLIRDWEAALKESRRVLKDSGALFIGYTTGHADTPTARLRQKLHDLTLESCPDAPQFGPGSIEERNDWLLHSGARLDNQEAATWVETINLGETIDTYAQGIHSGTQRIPPEQRPEIMNRLRAWALNEFGSLDFQFEATRRFVWERFRWK